MNLKHRQNGTTPTPRAKKQKQQIRQLKNEIHGVLLDNGVRDRALGSRLSDYPTRAEELLKTVELSAASVSASKLRTQESEKVPDFKRKRRWPHQS